MEIIQHPTSNKWIIIKNPTDAARKLAGGLNSQMCRFEKSGNITVHSMFAAKFEALGAESSVKPAQLRRYVTREDFEDGAGPCIGWCVWNDETSQWEAETGNTEAKAAFAHATWMM